jgi:hypothetical protein
MHHTTTLDNKTTCIKKNASPKLHCPNTMPYIYLRPHSRLLHDPSANGWCITVFATRLPPTTCNNATHRQQFRCLCKMQNPTKIHPKRKADKNWKSTETLIHQLIDSSSKGGNYLLNVGPTAEGEIPAAAVIVLTIANRKVIASSDRQPVQLTTSVVFVNLRQSAIAKEIRTGPISWLETRPPFC